MIPFARILSYGNINAPQTLQMSTGYTSNPCTYMLLSNGDLYGSGYNDDGQLGQGDRTNRFKTTVRIATNVKLAHYGETMGMWITNENRIFICGRDNAYSSAGTIRSTPMEKTSFYSSLNIDDIVDIKCALNVYMLMKNGDLYVHGMNRYGELGTGNNTSVYSAPVLLTSNVKKVYIGSQSNQVILLKNDNTIWGCGNNNSSNLGFPVGNILTLQQMFSTVPAYTFNGLKVTGSHTILFTKSRTYYACGSSNYGAWGTGSVTAIPATTLYTGTLPFDPGDMTELYHYSDQAPLVTFALDTNNVLYGCGWGSSGLNGSSTSNVGIFTPVLGISTLPVGSRVLSNYSNGYIHYPSTYTILGNANPFQGLDTTALSTAFTVLQHMPF